MDLKPFPENWEKYDWKTFTEIYYVPEHIIEKHFIDVFYDKLIRFDDCYYEDVIKSSFRK